MRKLLLFLLIILTACTNTISDNSVLYMEPTSEGNLYDYLSDELKKEFESINSSKPIDDYVLKAIGNNLTEMTIKDINGEELSFPKKGKVLIEAVAYWCPHCKKQIENNQEIINKYLDISFYQYFNEGDKEQIKEFYEGYEIPDNISIIPNDEQFSTYIMSFNPEYYPTFFFFEDGVCTYVCYGDIDVNKMNLLYDKAFSFKKENLVNNDGVNIFDLYIDVDKLFNSLSNENQQRLNDLSNSKDLTLSIMSKEVYFNDLYKAEDTPYSLDDFSSYIDSKLVVFYLAELNLENNIEIINEFIEAHKELKVLTILCDNKDMNTSKEYQSLNIQLKGDISSSKGYLPKTLADLKVSYPTAIFIENNRFMGGFSDINNTKLEFAYVSFIGENSIALKENN